MMRAQSLRNPTGLCSMYRVIPMSDLRVSGDDISARNQDRFVWIVVHQSCSSPFERIYYLSNRCRSFWSAVVLSTKLFFWQEARGEAAVHEGDQEGQGRDRGPNVGQERPREGQGALLAVDQLGGGPATGTGGRAVWCRRGLGDARQRPSVQSERHGLRRQQLRPVQTRLIPPWCILTRFYRKLRPFYVYIHVFDSVFSFLHNVQKVSKIVCT